MIQIKKSLKKNIRRILSFSSQVHDEKTLPMYQYIPEGWNYVDEHKEVRGWNVEEILRMYEQRWEIFQKRVMGKDPLGYSLEADPDSAPNINTQNTILCFAYCLALLACNHSRVSILDWGGGIGQYYVIAQALFPRLDVDYHCKDFELFTTLGKRYLPNVNFYTDETCLVNTYDFVLVSGAIQYSRDWDNVLIGLANATGEYLLLTRLPIVEQVPSFTFLQRAYKFGFNTEFLSWCFNKTELMKKAESSGLKLVREFVVGDSLPIVNAPEKCQYSGYLFQKIDKSRIFT